MGRVVVWLVIVVGLLGFVTNGRPLSIFFGSKTTTTADVSPQRAQKALDIANQLRNRPGTSDLVTLLRFVHFYELGNRDRALAVLELANHEIARAIVKLSVEQGHLSDEILELDLEEAAEIRIQLAKIGNMTVCETAVESGFKPLTGDDFCKIWDSGVLELLPLPSRLLTVAEKVAVRGLLTRLPRMELAGMPRVATIMSRREGRREALRRQLAEKSARENALTRQLVDLAWNMALD